MMTSPRTLRSPGGPVMHACGRRMSLTGADRLAELLARTALRDQSAFEALYRATAPKLFGFGAPYIAKTGRGRRVACRTRS